MAVLLSLDLEPEPTCTGYDWIEEPGIVCERRLKIAVAHVSMAGPLRPLGRWVIGQGADTVSLGEFAEWAISMGWELPERFPRGALHTAPAQIPAPVVDTKPDVTLMATRQQLIDAFGSFTGMNASWFSNIKDTPALLAARKVTGQGGRGHIAEPLFSPFEVLQWLIDPARRKGRTLGQDKGWELFERNFPRAYAAFSVGDTRTD
jgi:hypothetical protein